MASKKTAAILTIAGGVFYMVGGAVVAGLFYLLGSSSGLSGLGLSGSGSQSVCSFFPGFPCDSNATVSGIGGLGGTGGIDMSGVGSILLAIGPHNRRAHNLRRLAYQL